MNILEELYRGNMGYNAMPYPQNAEYAEAVSFRECNLEKLMEKLDDEGKEIFQKFIEAQRDAEGFTLTDTFAHGLKLGVRLMTEVFKGR